ncbi:hypothetical protein OH77DRAFT_1154659 [Trametes cingulata]|nr:hypothetical protein OH77DRAFT_1154659 [Trametes cingulata]
MMAGCIASAKLSAPDALWRWKATCRDGQCAQAPAEQPRMMLPRRGLKEAEHDQPLRDGPLLSRSISRLCARCCGRGRRVVLSSAGSGSGEGRASSSFPCFVMVPTGVDPHWEADQNLSLLNLRRALISLAANDSTVQPLVHPHGRACARLRLRLSGSGLDRADAGEREREVERASIRSDGGHLRLLSASASVSASASASRGLCGDTRSPPGSSYPPAPSVL